MRRFFIIFMLLLSAFTISAQKKKKGKGKDYVDPDAALKQELVEYKKDCRVALKPYRYDGQKTTFFSYKSYEYMKEVEVATINNTDYRLSVNSNGIHGDKIKIKIYDKPKDQKGRVLLYERSSVGGNAFTFETAAMLQKLKEYKRSKGVSEEIIAIMRLKKLYIDYIIPAVERTTEENELSGKQTVSEERGAIIVCLGYLNLDDE